MGILSTARSRATSVVQHKSSLAESAVRYFSEAFHAFDRTNSGTIDAANLRDLLYLLGDTTTTEADLEAIMSNVNLERTNAIVPNESMPGIEQDYEDVPAIFNFEEFLHFVTRYMRLEDEKLNPRHVFRVFDVDGNGCISFGELEAILNRDFGMDLCPEEIRAMVSIGDASLDGELNLREFREVYQRYREGDSGISSELGVVDQ